MSLGKYPFLQEEFDDKKNKDSGILNKNSKVCKVWWKCKVCNESWQEFISERIKNDKTSHCHPIDKNVSVNNYTLRGLQQIASKFFINFGKTWNKPVMVKIINKTLEEERIRKEEERIKEETKDDYVHVDTENEDEKKDKEIINYEDDVNIFCCSFTSNNKTIIVPIRKDGYINATILCKAVNKRFNNWYRQDSIIALCEAISLNTQISADKLIDSKKGRYGGSYIHRRLAYHLAMWCCPDFAVQVSNWLDELLLTGKIEIGEEKSDEDLEKIWKGKINLLEDKIRKNKILLEEKDMFLIENKKQIDVQEKTIKEMKEEKERQDKKYENEKKKKAKKHPYVKFDLTYDKGPAYYIFSYGRSCDKNCRSRNFHKHGIAGTKENKNIDNRLQSHRTTYPQLILRTVIFTKDAPGLEKYMARHFSANLNPSSHEIFETVNPKELEEKAIQWLEFNLSEYGRVPEKDIDSYNENVSKTIKDPGEFSESSGDEKEEEDPEITDMKKSIKNLKKYTIKELQTLMEKYGVPYGTKLKKADLQDLLRTFLKEKIGS